MEPTTLLEWVADTGYIEAFLIIVLPAFLITILGILFVRAVYPPEELSGSQVASAKMNYMSEIYSVVLGLILVGAFSNYLDMVTVVKTEAFALRGLHDFALNLRQPEGDRLAEQIRHYTRSVATEEWPLMKFGEDSQKTQQELDRIFGGIARISDQRSVSLERLAQEVLTQRAIRVSSSFGDGDTLSRAFSHFLALITFAAIALPWFLYSPHPLLHILTGGMLTTVFVSIIVMSVKMLYPFAGELAIQPTEFQMALLAMLEQLNETAQLSLSP